MDKVVRFFKLFTTIFCFKFFELGKALFGSVKFEINLKSFEILNSESNRTATRYCCGDPTCQLPPSPAFCAARTRRPWAVAGRQPPPVRRTRPPPLLRYVMPQGGSPPTPASPRRAPTRPLFKRASLVIAARFSVPLFCSDRA
jgi:hypothetical protein